MTTVSYLWEYRNFQNISTKATALQTNWKTGQLKFSLNLELKIFDRITIGDVAVNDRLVCTTRYGTC